MNHRRNKATWRAASAAGLLFALASAAHAGEIDKTGKPDLVLEVGGDIEEACGLGPIASADLGDLNQTGLTADTDFALDCNVPFDVQIESSSGGLRNLTHPDGQGPYFGRVGYTMTFQMPVLTPASLLVSQSYTATELVGGRSISSQGGVAFDGAHMHLDLDTVASPGLAAGQYSETISLTVAPTL